LLQELSAPGSEPLVIPATLPTAKTASPQESQQATKAQQAIQTTSPLPENALAPFLAAQDDTRCQLERLSAQLAEIERRESQPAQDSRQMWVFAVAVVLAIVLLLAGVTVSAFLKDSQAALLSSVAALVVLIAALVLPSVRR